MAWEELGVVRVCALRLCDGAPKKRHKIVSFIPTSTICSFRQMVSAS
jgi:hypothetical protein